MSQLTSLCLLLIVAAAAVFAYPAEQGVNLLDLDAIFDAAEPEDEGEIQEVAPNSFDRERRRQNYSCMRECSHCAKIHTRYSMVRCFRTCSSGRTDFGCNNRMHFV